MPDDIAELRAKIERIAEDVAGIKALLQSEPQRCAYREQIAKAMNSIEERKALAVRVSGVEDAIHRLDLTLTKIAVIVLASGSVGAGIVKILEKIL